jgi:hypothetical protein
MKRRARRKAPWERSTRRPAPEEYDHESLMELQALINDSLGDMFRRLTPLEPRLSRQEIWRNGSRSRRELPCPGILAGWGDTPAVAPEDRQWYGLSVVLGTK